jgi:hypothetical protein
MHISRPGCPFGDPDGEWQRIRGISDSGAVLVRPESRVGSAVCSLLWLVCYARVSACGEQNVTSG